VRAYPDEPRYLNPYLAGVMLGLVLFASFIITGHGLGASGGMSQIMAGLTDLFASAHVNRNFYLAPMAGGSNSPLGGWLVWGMAGTMLGGLLSGLIAKRVRVEIRRGPRLSPRARLLFAFAGGSLVGFGARLARGCTSGQALSGGAVLSAGSWAFMFAVFGGGYLLAYFVRKLWN
jgi:uncharacterized membrane protein YedE/YeeE